MSCTTLLRIRFGLFIFCAGLASVLAWQSREKTRQIAESTNKGAGIRRLKAQLKGVQDALQIDADSTDHNRDPAGTPDQPRGNAATVQAVIDQIKRAHAISPPAPRPLRSPIGPSGIFFPELMDNLEYSRACLEYFRSTKTAVKATLLELGVPETIQNQVIDVLADSDVARLDAEQLLNASGVPFNEDVRRAAEKEEARIDDQVRALLGDEVFREYTQKVSHFGGLTNGRASLDPLVQRLSYTETPLLPGQVGDLTALIAQSTAPSNRGNSVLVMSPGFLELAKPLLAPGQLEALHQLYVEREAAVARGKLPPSSELPRNQPP
jgi:hypothetical protein